MIITRYVTPLFAGALLLLCSCSDSGRRVPSQLDSHAPLPELVRPVLSGQSVYELGADITIRVVYPASDWRIDDDLQKEIGGDRGQPLRMEFTGDA